MGVGLLIDRLFAPYVAFFIFSISAFALLLFSQLGLEVVMIAALAIGLCMGAEVDLISFLTSRYFPQIIYGKIYGLLYSIFIIGSASSPMMMGALYDHYKDYHDALAVSVIALFISAILVLFLPKYGATK